ncbi:ABC transporter ATP-binding protein [Salinirubellus sp. GCM10025818]|uniref:ABC transporter ATP-binding protein n=1 Tax=Salinirubellus TaxID=2162630 RepID=UPI0030D2CE4F
MATRGGTDIQYENVTKQYGETTAVDEINISIERGEFMAIIGPSGSGKTTTLRMLAGFETPTTGDVSLAGTSLVGVPPHKRDTATVFQDYALFPHMSVGENIAFGLKNRGYDRKPVDERVSEVLELVDMAGMEGRRPASLSGGQQQRVATARALAPEPKVLLMDEPLGALDKKLRDQIRVDFARLQQELGITTLYVTHNQEEALTMADRVAVMNDGRIEQIGTPTEVYRSPRTEFVSDFIGDTNILHGDITEVDGRVVIRMAGSEIRLDYDGDLRVRPTVFVRPEDISLASAGAEGSADNVLTGELQHSLFLGDKYRYYVDVDGQEFIVNGSGKRREFEDGDEVVITWDNEDTTVVSD